MGCKNGQESPALQFGRNRHSLQIRYYMGLRMAKSHQSVSQQALLISGQNANDKKPLPKTPTQEMFA